MADEQKTLDDGDPDFGPHPDRYHQLCEPFDGPDEAQESLDKFIRLVNKARIECGIPEALIANEVSIKYPGGEIGRVVAVNYFGDALRAESLAAYAFGQMQAERQQMIAESLEHACKAIRRRQTPRRGKRS